MKFQRSSLARRAISGIIAGLLLFVILFTVGTGYFLWIYTNNGTYSHAQAGRQQSAIAQNGESMLVAASVNGTLLEFTALNQGGSQVNLVQYFVNVGTGVVSQGALTVYLNAGSSPYRLTTSYNCSSCSIANPATVEILTARGNVFSATYPPASASSCSGGSVTPSLSTVLSSTAVTAGSGVSDTAILTDGCNPTGNITFKVYYNDATCTTASVFTSNAIIVSGNGPYTSLPQFLPQNVGTYYWKASYSGDTSNLPTFTPCGTSGEVLTVSKASPSVTTSLSASSIPSGQSVSDSASISKSSGSNTAGTVTYSYFSDGTCTGSPMVTPSNANGLIVTVSGGLVPSSPATVFISVGPYSWEAAYSGDSNNFGTTSACEPLSVTSPSTQTQLPLAVEINSFRFLYAQGYGPGDGFAPGVGGYFGYVVPSSTTMVFAVTLVNVDPFGRAITLNSFSFLYVAVLSNGGGQCYPFPLYVVGGVSDLAPYTSGVSTSAYTSPVTIAYQGTATIYFGSSSPGGTGGSSLACAAAGKTPSPLEAAVAPFLTGEFSDGAPLSLTLPFTSIYATPSSVSNCSPASGGVQCSAATGSTVHLTFASGSFASTPTVFYVPSFGATPIQVACAGGTCTAIDFFFSVPGGTTQGSYYMVFATDGTNYAYSTLHVINSPTIATTLSQTTIVHGNSVSDGSALSGVTPTAGGTLTYQFFANGNCLGSGTIVSIVTVTNGMAPSSASHTFANAGAYSWDAVYSGDPNNAGTTSPCEQLTVTTAFTIIPNTFAHNTVKTITLSGSNLETSTSYSYCLSTSSLSISCVPMTTASPSPGTFTSTNSGAVPSNTNEVTTNSIATGTYYYIVYQGNQIVGFATLTVT